MKTLFISHIVPHPLDSGTNQRIFHLLRAIAAVSDITFVFACATKEPEVEAAPIRHLVSRVRSFPFTSFALQRDLRLPRVIRSIKIKLRHFHPWEPLSLQYSTSSDGRELVRELCRQQFDIIWAEKLRGMRLIPDRVSGRVIVDLDDLEHRKLGWWLRKGEFSCLSLRDGLEFLRYRAAELHAVRHPYEFIVCSDIDRNALAGTSHVHVVPNGIELPRIVARTSFVHSQATFVFVGEMSYPPNIDAVRFFVTQIFPSIKRQLSQAQFFIVGRNPVPSVLRLHDGYSVIVTGTVNSVEPYLREATAAVVPLRSGGGTRIKILEALAYGVPVVTTSVGAEGLELENNRHVLLADTPIIFGRACISLYDTPALGKRLAEAGMKLVKQKFQWDAIESKVKQLIAPGINFQQMSTQSGLEQSMERF